MSAFHHNLTMIFTQTDSWNFPRITITPGMFKLLSVIDGRKSVAEIAELLGISYASLFADLQQLHDKRLIKLTEQSTEPVEVQTKTIKAIYRGTPLTVERSASADTSISSRRPRKDHYRGVSYSPLANS